MFESLSDNLQKVFKSLTKKGLLSEADVSAAMREVRIALLEADVALPVVKAFVEQIKEKAVGEKVVKSISPGQMVIKLVQDHLIELLGSEVTELNLKAKAPVVIMMAGLQGSGKTTSTGKLANMLSKKQKKKVLMASLDVYRPAAQEQLEVLGKQIGVDTVSIVKGQKPDKITTRALKEAKLGGYDVLFLDTAGRLHIDVALMKELQKVKKLSDPAEIMLVADSLTGQDAVHIAQEFHKSLDLTGIMLTRIDGDARGGAALSMRHVTERPIKFMGIGEKIEDLEVFHPERIASRILGMGDVVSLVEKASETVSEEEAEKLTKKIKKGTFDLEDLAKQLKVMRKMGGFGSIMGMMPGLGGLKKKVDESKLDDSMLIKQEALISSMTKQERRFPKAINLSRKNRIAKGSGQSVQAVNRLLKQHKMMSKAMKKLGNMDEKTLMRSGLGKMLPKGLK